MKSLDQASSLFLLLVSISVFAESLQLGIGRLHDPGMGFMAFCASGVLGILSLVLLIQASFKKEEIQASPFFSGPLWRRVIFVLVVLVVWARVMPVLGYLISTFLAMTSLYWILERKKIWLVIVCSVATTFLSYLIFSKWLNCQFPDGFFGF